MERGKSGSGRGGKTKAPQFPSDLIALGSKSSSDSKPRPSSSSLAPKVLPLSSGLLILNYTILPQKVRKRKERQAY